MGGFPPASSGDPAKDAATRLNDLLPGGIMADAYWKYVKQWWPMRDEPNVLLLHYSDVKRDLAGAVARIASWLGVALTDDERSMDDYSLCTDETIITVLAPWEFTGSWGDVASPTCTEGQGPSSCVQSYPPTEAPNALEGADFTITGSTNYNGSGVLTILSGQHSGWSQVTFTGGCKLKSAETEPGWDLAEGADPTADENELSGSFDVATQTWTVQPDDVEDTTAARC